ncbi:MAG: MFS transporter [Mangrovibacterium sp.]
MKSLLNHKLSLRWQIFGITWLSYAGFYFCRKNFSVAMPFFSHDLHISNMTLANIITAYSIMYMVGQFVSGFLNDWLGPRIVVGSGLLIAVISNFFIGIYASSFLFLVFMLFNGAGQSTGWSGLVRIMSEWFEKRERGIVMGWWTTCYVVGGIISVIFATWWATNNILPGLSWRKAFWAPSLFLLMITVIFWKFIRERPAHSFSEITPERKSDLVQKKTFRAEEFAVLKDPILWIAGAVYFFTKFIRYTFLFWIPLYLSQNFGYSDANAGYTSSVFEIAGFAGILFAGYLSDKLFRSGRFSVSALFLFTLGLFFLFQPVISSWGTWGNVLLIGACGFLIYGPDSLISAAGAMDISRNNTGLTAGFINGIGSVGQLLSPFFVAYVSEKYGWETLFLVFVWMAFAAGILLVFKWNYGVVRYQEKTVEFI